MEEISEKIIIQQEALSIDEISGKDEYDQEINLVIRREKVMNTVLEKLIDKLNQSHVPIPTEKR